MSELSQLAILAPGEPFPPVSQAWGPSSSAPGLLAVGGELDVRTLRAAYSATVFPWFSHGEPILWWSPDPRMVLQVDAFRLHRSLRKVIERFRISPACEIRFDTAFDDVMAACAASPRPGQDGTWIGPEMRRAYGELHRAGYAHSVETWAAGELVAGLYCVSIGRAVFGESMFAHATDASKIALAALVGLCRHHGVELIDCQQNTRHLASLGAVEIPRARFLAHVEQARRQPGPSWRFEPVYWNALLPPSVSTA